MRNRGKSEELRVNSEELRTESGTVRDVACNVFHPFTTTMNILQKCKLQSSGRMVAGEFEEIGFPRQEMKNGRIASPISP